MRQLVDEVEGTLRVHGLVVVYGRHVFKVMAGPAPETDRANWIRLSRYGWTPCRNVGEAIAWMTTFMFMSGGIRSEMDPPEGFGFVARSNGVVTHVVTAEGKAHKLRYIGMRGDVVSDAKATRTLFTMEEDTRFEGRAFMPGAADRWATAGLVDFDKV
jgi:hypothetical protein